MVPILIAEANESECRVPDPIMAGEASQIWRDMRLGPAISTFTCLFYHHRTFCMNNCFQKIVFPELRSVVIAIHRSTKTGSVK